MAASLQEIHELLYEIDRENLRELMVEGASAIKQVVLNKLSEEGIDTQPFMDTWNTFAGEKLEIEENTKEPKENTVHAIAATSGDVQPLVKNVKHEKISIALPPSSITPMPPPRKPAPRTKKIKSEPLDEPQKSTRSRSARNQCNNKDSVIIQVPDVPLIDLTNNCISPRRTRSKIRQATTQVNENVALQENSMIQLHKKNNLSEIVDNMNITEDNEEETKGNQQINANSASPDVVDEFKNKKGGVKEKNLFVNLNKIETQTDLNQTYTLSLKPQDCSVSVPVKQPPKEMNTPIKSNKPFTPLKNSKTRIPMFTKSPSSSSTPLGTYKPSQKVLRSEQKRKGQESLRKKEEVLQAMEKSIKTKDIRLQRGHEIKKEAQMKQEAARKLMDKTKAEEYLKKKQEGNPGNAGFSEKKRKELMYMTKKTPLLPTVDCYDSDEEHKRPNRPQYPTWIQSRLLEREEMVGNTTGKMNTLFIKNIVTPDLQEVFECIDAKKLVRSSSAHWKEPPRYTLFNNHNHFYFSEDEDV